MISTFNAKEIVTDEYKIRHRMARRREGTRMGQGGGGGTGKIT